MVIEMQYVCRSGCSDDALLELLLQYPSSGQTLLVTYQTTKQIHRTDSRQLIDPQCTCAATR